MKRIIVLAIIAFASYYLLTRNSHKTTEDFKSKIDSLSKVNDSLLLVNMKDNSTIIKLQAIDDNLNYQAQHQKVKIVKVKEIVEVEKNRIDNLNERELVSYFNQRYPKDTTTNPLPVAQPVLTFAAKDLVAYDGAKEELIAMDSIIELQEDRIEGKDSIITLYGDKEVRYKGMLDNKDKVILEWNKQYDVIKAQNKKLKTQSKIQKIGIAVLAGGLIYTVIQK